MTALAMSASFYSFLEPYLLQQSMDNSSHQDSIAKILISENSQDTEMRKKGLLGFMGIDSFHSDVFWAIDDIKTFKRDKDRFDHIIVVQSSYMKTLPKAQRAEFILQLQVIQVLQLQNLDQTLCSKSEQKFSFLTKPQLPNLQKTVVNTILIINISNRNNLN